MRSHLLVEDRGSLPCFLPRSLHSKDINKSALGHAKWSPHTTDINKSALEHDNWSLHTKTINASALEHDSCSPPHHRDGTHARHMQGYRKSLMQIRHKQVQAYSNCSRGAQAYDADFPAEVHKYTVQVSQHTRDQPPLRLQYMADNTQSSPHTQYRQT